MVDILIWSHPGREEEEEEEEAYTENAENRRKTEGERHNFPEIHKLYCSVSCV